MPGGVCLVSRSARAALTLLGLLVLAPFAVLVVASVLAGVGGLLDAFGWWGLVIALVPTAAILLFGEFH